MIKRINESKAIFHVNVKHILCEYRYGFDGRNCNSSQKWNNDKCQCECKQQTKLLACEES